MSEYFYEQTVDKKWRLVWVVFVICVVVASGVFLSVYYFLKNSVVPEDPLCLSEDCLKAASEFISSLDLSKDPCQDFHQFTCGKFIEKAYENNNPSYYYLQEVQNTNKINALIAEEIIGEEWPLFLQQKRFYQSCIDTQAIDEEQNEIFKDLLEGLGGWPLLKGQQWRKKNFDLGTMILKCQHLGFPFEWFFQVVYDAELDELRILVPEPMNQFNGPFKEAVYENLMVETASNLGTSRILAKNAIDGVLHFTKKLNELILESSDDCLENLNTTALDDVFPRLSWLHFINNLTGDFNFTVSEGDASIVACYDYLQKLSLLLGGTSLRTQVNFINWRIIQEFGFYLPTPIRENFVNFTNFLVSYGEQVHTRFDFCMREARTRFSGVAEYQFIKLYIDEQKQDGINEMTTNIKQQFVSYLEGLSWIHGCTKEILVNELNKIVDIIEPVLDYVTILNDTNFQVSDLEFTTDNIIDMVREKNMDDFWLQFAPKASKDLPSIGDLPKKLLSKALQLTDRKTVADFLSVGIIQDILYNNHRPNYLNYGTLGSIIGREISRRFSQGTYYSYAIENDIDRECDEIAEIEKFVSWNMTELFQNNTENATHIINFVYKHFGINGEIKFSGNFDEVVGIHAAYMAYNKWSEENGVEEKLPGLPYTPSQLFWLQFGLLSCYSNIDGIEWSIDEETPIWFKDINFLQNSEYFKIDFKCLT